MEVPIKTVSKAQLGQLRPPSDADIQRSIAASSRSPQQKQASAKAMARLEKAAMQFVAMKQQGRQQPASQQQQSAAQKTAVKAPPRHHSVTPASYADKVAPGTRGRARVPERKTPEHAAIQRSIQGHIQRNVKREARSERFRQVGQQVKAKAAGMVQQVSRSARSVAPSSLSRTQTELAGKQKMQSMIRHREQVMDKGKGKEAAKVKGKERASVQMATPARQPQQTQGKGNDRGRSR